MNTPTHLLVAAAVLAKAPNDSIKPARGQYLLILLGGLVPDLAIFVVFGWERLINGVNESNLWRDVYWQEPWQTLVAIGNSAPLYAVLLLGARLFRLPLLTVFAVAALLHLMLDFPVHHDDAHPHFWPVTDWRFHSPLSYWNHNHFGGIVSMLELALAVVLIIVLCRRFTARPVRFALGLALITYFAVPAYFTLMLG